MQGPNLDRVLAGVPSHIRDEPEYHKMLQGDCFNCFVPTLSAAQVDSHERGYELAKVKRSQFSSLDEFLQARQQVLAKLFLSIGPGAHVGIGLTLDFGFNCVVGRGFRSGKNLTILDCNMVIIGDDCVFGDYVTVVAAQHPLEAALRSKIDTAVYGRAVQIGNGVVLGSRCVVLPGIRIGDGVMVEAGSIVTRDLDEGSWSGTPAKRIA